MKYLILFLLSMSPAAQAEVLTATRLLRAQTVLGPQDLVLVPGTMEDSPTSIAEAVGKETRVTIYPGRPIRRGDLGPPALVERNQLVTLSYRQGNLGILAEGRALARGGDGDLIRVMNLQSRTAVMGRVLSDGTVSVTP